MYYTSPQNKEKQMKISAILWFKNRNDSCYLDNKTESMQDKKYELTGNLVH